MHPKYGFISERKYILREVIRLRDFPVAFDNKEELVSINLLLFQNLELRYIFLKTKIILSQFLSYYMSRNGRLFKDNNDKFLFSKVALETLKQLLWKPDLIVCNDWQTFLYHKFLKMNILMIHF